MVLVCTVNPSNTFYAGNNSIDRGNNLRWLFTSCSQIKAVSQVIYSSAVSKVIDLKTHIYKICGLS